MRLSLLLLQDGAGKGNQLHVWEQTYLEQDASLVAVDKEAASVGEEGDGHCVNCFL